MINSFRGKYFFLSNFYEAPITYNGITYKNNEAAFQAQKDLSRCQEFINISPSEAKKLGRRVKLRPDWETAKNQIMIDIVYAKFSQNPDLKELLISTEDKELIEGNTWGDYEWGVCKGKGKNKLGRILMAIREKLRNES